MNGKSAIDPDALDRLREWGGDKLLAQMIQLFISNAGERMEQIRTGVRDSSVRDAEMGAHSLKSSAANLGAEAVRSIASDIELAAADGDIGPAVALLPGLEAAFVAAVSELESIGEGMAV